MVQPDRKPTKKTSRPARDSLPVVANDAEENASSCCQPSRRTFLKWVGAGVAAAPAVAASSAMAGPFTPADVSDHFVPADKKLNKQWLKALFAKGASTYYRGADLETIGMPVGGVCAGQVYLTGDGRLVHWDIFNRHNFTGYGRTSYDLGRVADPVLAQGTAIRIIADGKVTTRRLDVEGFPGLRFCGEYPIGFVEYNDAALPVEIRLDAFSPFIPLNEENSDLPVTILQYTLTNRSEQRVDVELASWLENGVSLHTAAALPGLRRNHAGAISKVKYVESSSQSAERPDTQRPPIVVSDFEGSDYGDWTVEGEAFGDGPARGTLPSQQSVSGFQGKGLVNTFIDRDGPHGKIISPTFKIERRFINFLVGGGNHQGKTCVNLIIHGQMVFSTTGKNKEQLAWEHWDVRQHLGKEARIEIVDQESTGWGHINVDQIELSDQVRIGIEGTLEEQDDFGTMCLAVFDDRQEAFATARVNHENDPAVLFDPESHEGEAESPFGTPLVGAVGSKVSIDPGQSVPIRFAAAWCFPRREERGNFYATRFANALEVIRYVAENFKRLDEETRRWHGTWYDSTLPHWLLDRLFSTVSTLATSTCQWWSNGRFWAWEGVGCCRGTCTHVWNYEHAMARLFPRLERSVREMQDFEPAAGFDDATGMVRFRGENWDRWAGDGQAGTVLKAYREHLMSGDHRFLRKNWTRIRKAMQFLIDQDDDGNGVLERAQHNTYDIDFYGPNTMIGSLYLAALRAAEKMSRIMDDGGFANLCRSLSERGSKSNVEQLFNGEYFIQQVDLEAHPKFQYATGCLSDQLFGQGWSHQVGLGYVYSEPVVAETLRAIWRYNWAPDVGPQNDVHSPERWFARPGEAGLFTCTWPKGGYIEEGVRYRNEVWTGIEYQVAGNMAWDGMVTEALAICRGIHDRYHPLKHNPWNEVECGDHYARGMASYGVFLALCGFEYDGPSKMLGFSPRITPEDFRAAFTAAQGWGTIAQERGDGRQRNTISVKWGQLALSSLALELPKNVRIEDATVQLGARTVAAEVRQDGQRVVLNLAESVELGVDETLAVEFEI